MKPVLATLAVLVALLLHPDHSGAHVRGCHSRACDQRVHAKRRTYWKHHHIWLYRFHHLSLADRVWARCIASWETHGTPWARKATVVGIGGHLGAVQFDPRTAVAAGFHRPVTSTSLYEQLVRAVWWRNRSSVRQWQTYYHCS